MDEFSDEISATIAPGVDRDLSVISKLPSRVRKR
jgi:hypothetical protein